MDKYTTHRVLVAAKALIDTPDKWIKGQNAQNSSNEGVGVLDNTATCFCTLGAVIKAADTLGTPNWKAADTLRAEVKKKAQPSTLATYNDASGTTHAMIMELFDKAIGEVK